MRLPRQSVLMILIMTVLMGLILSAIFTLQDNGFSRTFVGNWLTRFGATYILVLPTVLIVSPIAQRLASWFDNKLGHDPSPIDIALAAWNANAAGHRGESFEPWLSMLADDVSISMPLGEFRGANAGSARAREIYTAIASAMPRLTYEKPLRVTATGQTVMIEFDDHGTIAGTAYKNRIAASFDIRDGKVAAYREYFGDIDPVIVQLMTGEN